MKHIILAISAALTILSAAAQNADTTSTLAGEKLNFEEPNFMVSTYFESVKAHLSKEGRKAWKPEFSLRFTPMIYMTSFDLTGGIRTSPNKVFGLGIGRSSVYYDAFPARDYRINVYVYHRHYLPFDKRRRFSLYSDLMGGGSYIYKSTKPDPMDTPKQGDWTWWFSWQPGLSIRLWGKSNIFFGPTIGPSFGAHIGIAL